MFPLSASLHRACLLLLLFWGSAAAQAPSVDELLARGIALYQTSDVIGAIELYQLALQKAPERADIRSNLGAAYARLGRYQQAIDHYRSALAQAPDLTPVRFNLALAFYKSARIPDARAELERVLEAEPANHHAVLLLADCHAQLGNDAAVVSLLTAREADFKDDRFFAYLLGNALIRRNELMRGQTYIDRLFRDGESAEAHVLMGAAHLARRDAKSAVPELEKAVGLNPAMPTVHSLLGRALIQAGRRDDAATAFARELEQNPNDFDSNLYLGVLLKDENRLDEAQQHLLRASRLRPDDPGVLYALGALHLAADRVHDAQKALEAVTELVPDYTQGHVLLATVYYRQKKKDLGDRHRDIAQKLTAEQQALEPGALTDPIPGYGGGRGGEAPVPRPNRKSGGGRE